MPEVMPRLSDDVFDAIAERAAALIELRLPSTPVYEPHTPRDWGLLEFGAAAGAMAAITHLQSQGWKLIPPADDAA